MARRSTSGLAVAIAPNMTKESTFPWPVRLYGQLGLTGIAVFVLSLVVVHLVSTDFDWMRDYVSYLANEPLGSVFLAGAFVHGWGNLALALGLRGALLPGRLRTWAVLLFSLFVLNAAHAENGVTIVYQEPLEQLQLAHSSSAGELKPGAASSRTLRFFAFGKRFDMNDFREQLEQMMNMGGLSGLMDKLPGMGQLPQNAKSKVNDRELHRMVAIINSMTQQERSFPDVIKGSRRRRIAAGSGTQVQDVNRLLKQHLQMRKMMKKMSKGGMGKMLRGLKGKAPQGFPFQGM